MKATAAGRPRKRRKNGAMAGRLEALDGCPRKMRKIGKECVKMRGKGVMESGKLVKGAWKGREMRNGIPRGALQVSGTRQFAGFQSTIYFKTSLIIAWGRAGAQDQGQRAEPAAKAKPLQM